MKALVIVCALIMGCASISENPQELNISHATIVDGGNKTKVEIDGFSSKGSGAVAGGAKGAGIGAGTAAVACLPIPPPFYPFCLGAYGTLFGVTGATIGAVSGSASAEDSASVEEKRIMLEHALTQTGASQRLATLVYQKTLDDLTVKTTDQAKSQTAIDSSSQLRIVLDSLETVGSGPNVPYSLKLSAHTELTHSGNKKPVFIKEYQAQNPLKMSTAGWQGNNDEPVLTVVNDLLATLATDILNDLMPIQLSLDISLQNYQAPEKNRGTDTETKPLVVLKIRPDQSLSPVNQEVYNPNQTSLFDPITGMDWIVVDSYPVDFPTAQSICASLEKGEKKKYRIPSLNEFEELWKRYKNDEQISIFKKREYNTDRNKHLIWRTAYTQTFSFASGNSGALYAAYLTCVSK